MYVGRVQIHMYLVRECVHHVLHLCIMLINSGYHLVFSYNQACSLLTTYLK